MDSLDKSAITDRLKSEARDICPLCQQTLWLSFYFDAFGHHKDEDNDSVSNVGKLWAANFDKREKGIRRYYYPGLGKHFDPELALLAAMETKKIAEDAKKAELDIAMNSAAKSGKAVVKETWQHKEGWWARIERELKKDTKKLYEKYKGQHDIIFNKTERAQYLRGIQRYWKNFAEDLIHHPQRAIKYVKNELAKATAGHVAERWSFVRDAGWISALFNTGVDTRLEAAVHDFEEAVSASQQLGTIKHINVAVFGADMGGALAIAFANKLLKDVCEKGKYQGTKVHIRFMGLFDCVTARFDDNFLTGFVPLANSIAGDLKMPKQVERVVHYAAAHENRLYKPLSSIGGVNKNGARLEERLFPGAQQDVTGGYGHNEQGIDNQLSRLPLCMMLGRAWRYGVPVYTLDRLENDDAPHIVSIYAHFKIDPKLNDQVYAYWNKIKELSTVIQTVQSTMSFQELKASAHSCVAMALPASMNVVPADIKGLLPAHSALYISWLKCWYSKPHNSNNPTEVKRHQFLEKEIKRMERAAKLAPFDAGSLSKEEQVIWQQWQGNSAATLGGLTPLFERHVHDSMAESVLEQVWDDFFYSRHYLHYRVITTIEELPDRSFFESLWDKTTHFVGASVESVGKKAMLGK